MDLNIETKLSTRQKILLPLYSPFSIRHLKKQGWLNKLVGGIELFPGICLIGAVLEIAAKKCLSKKKPPSDQSKPLKGQDVSLTPNSPKTTQRVVIVANKKVFMKHLTGEKHPESPQRVEAIENALTQANLMNNENTIKPRKATEAEISLCHDRPYQEELKKQIKQLSTVENFNNSEWKVEHVPGDFNISPHSLKSSLFAAGAPLTAIEHILDEKNKTSRAFCIVRPPGHHAHEHTGSGFCVFNNVAIAAKHLTKNLGFKRVLIVDWDAHHGDGTQKLTEKDGTIFYFSTHKDTAVDPKTNRSFYPGSHWGRASETGGNKKQRTVLNCPVSGTDDQCRTQILDAFRNQLVPAMEQYKPDFVLISCGFDGHKNDSLVGLGLNDEDYIEMTNICVGIAEKHAKGRIVSVLEGGYNLDAISGAAKVHVQALSGKGV